MCTRFPTSFTSSTSTSSTSHTSHTSSTSPTSLLQSLHHLHHLHQLHLHHMNHIHHPPTSWTQSTGAERLHLSYKTPTMSFAQEFLHRSSYAGDLWQELLHRSCYTGVATHEFASRWPTCIWTPTKLLYFSSSSKFLSFGGRGSQAVAHKTWPSGETVRVGRQNAWWNLRRSSMSDAQACGDMRILLARKRPSVDSVCRMWK
jgi:hypothetical protein